ncbi:hypothetical protein UPYG_G00249150 [Umbra pygmaea]|uniref:Uncharacterized protein n=1 Tax=Umbra pygmaea TaxID=75934 RepID=A0ABD0WBX9_UMBPY
MTAALRLGEAASPPWVEGEVGACPWRQCVRPSRWSSRPSHGELHPEEEAALHHQTQEAHEHGRHQASPRPALPHTQEPHPEGLHQYRRMETL